MLFEAGAPQRRSDVNRIIGTHTGLPGIVRSDSESADRREVVSSGQLPTVAELSSEGLATLKVTCVACVHCCFLRPYVIDPEWHAAIAALEA
jgi:hypothetical protein